MLVVRGRAWPSFNHRSRAASQQGVLAAVAANHRQVQIFDPTDALCPDGLCRSHDRHGRLLYRDRDHLNELGVLTLDADLRRFLQHHSLVYVPPLPAAKDLH